jgi:hypothetical protein
MVKQRLDDEYKCKDNISCQYQVVEVDKQKRSKRDGDITDLSEASKAQVGQQALSLISTGKVPGRRMLTQTVQPEDLDFSAASPQI